MLIGLILTATEDLPVRAQGMVPLDVCMSRFAQTLQAHPCTW